MGIEYIYNGKDNTIDLQLKADEAAVDLSGVTRMTLDIDGALIDSNLVGAGEGEAFDWTQGSGKLVLALGTVEAQYRLPAGGYIAKLTVYDSVNTNGIVWGKIRVKVED